MPRGRPFKGKITPYKPRPFAKKILVNKPIRINAKYGFMASIWVPNTPASNFKPTIALTLSHSDSVLRLCFDSVTDMREAVDSLRSFVLDKAYLVHDAYCIALQEFLEYHEGKRMQGLNDNTASTVIQDITKYKYSPKRKFVNKQTGEITEI